MTPATPKTGRKMRGSYSNVRGLRDWYAQLNPNSVGVEVGSYCGESAEIALQSGNVARLTCVDPWNAGEWAAAEGGFDQVMARWPGQIQKLKLTSEAAAAQFGPQSLDFVYIDACHDYAHVKEDIALWRGKVKAGGWIGGHDYQPHFEGLMRAVHEAFGRVQSAFMDGSWLVRVPSGNHEIVTYCSENFAPCLQRMLPSWIEFGRADRIHIWGEGPAVANVVATANAKHVVYHADHALVEGLSPTALRDLSWWRKIEVQARAYQLCRAQYFCWLDADVMALRSFGEAFGRLGRTHLGATRMFRASARGPQTCNSGVIFYRHAPELGRFFELWRARAADNQKTRHGGIWFEQQAMSDLAHEAYLGRHPFLATPVPSELFNSEEDSREQWLQNCTAYQPRLVHFKGGKWKDDRFVAEVLATKQP